MTSRVKWAIIGGLIATIVFAILATLSIGTAHLSIQEVANVVISRLPLPKSFRVPFGGQTPITYETIVFDIRLPRIILSLLVGFALSAAGVVFQGIFQNPMAEPYVIGVSSGAAFGASLGFALNMDIALLGLGSVPIFAFFGSLLSTLIVYNIARVGSRVPLTVLLLAGIAVGAFMSSVNSMILVFNREQAHQILFWLMGGFSARSWKHVYAVFPYILFGYGILTLFTRELNILSLGEDKARQLGVNTQQVHRILVAAAALITAAAVSVSGIIGFVGLIIPHMVRLVIGPDHRFLLPTAALGGALFLLLADTLARTAFSPVEIPVGVITSLAGAPFFLYLLRKYRYGWR